MKKFVYSKGKAPRGQFGKRKDGDKLMWDIGISEVKDLWAPKEQRAEASVVMTEVLTTLLEDTGYINAMDYVVPAAKGDEKRAELCAAWLLKNTPTWIRKLARETTRSMISDELVEYASDLDGQSLIEQIGTLQSAAWILPQGGHSVRRSKMIQAQSLGIRAVYRGAQHSSNVNIQTVTFYTLPLIMCALPEEPKDGEKLLMETVRASIMTLLIALEEEDDDGAKDT